MQGRHRTWRSEHDQVSRLIGQGGAGHPPQADRRTPASSRAKDFTLPQLFAVLVLRKFFRTDYRGIVAMLGEWSELRRVLKLPKVPNYSTLWYAEQKLMKRGLLLGCCPRASIALGASA